MLPIVITGGPCAGKTSVLDYLSRHLTERGINFVMVPEAATALINAGISRFTVGPVNFQQSVFDLQLADEDIFAKSARNLSDPDPLLILDRGLMDGKGFITDDEFEGIRLSYNLTEEEVFSRYGLVVHLESIAVSQPELYSHETNEARFETLEEAVESDRQMLRVWEGHPRRTVIRCHKDFEAKCREVLDVVLDYVESQRA